MIKKVIFRDLHNANGNAGIASVRFYDENKELIQSGSASSITDNVAKYMNMIVTSAYFKTTTKRDDKGNILYYRWTVDRAFKTSNSVSAENCWVSDQINTFDTIKVEFLAPVYKMSQIKFITSNAGVGGDAPAYKITQPFYIDFYDEMNNLLHSYEVVPLKENPSSVQTFLTNELNINNLGSENETIWNVWIRPFRLINGQVVFYNGTTIYAPTPAVCPPCNTPCPSYDVMLGNLGISSGKLDFWMLYDSFSNTTNSLEQAKKVIYDLITINGYEEDDIMLACDFPIRIGLN